VRQSCLGTSPWGLSFDERRTGEKFVVSAGHETFQ
jgi:hypothetical protein